MRSKRLHSEHDRVFVLVLEPGEEAVSSILSFAAREKLAAAQLTAVGAFSDAVLGCFERERKDYKRNRVTEQVEVASLAGTIALQDGIPRLHAHVVLGRSDGSALAGHLLEAHVWPTLEIVVVDSPSALERRKDPETGLALLVP